MSHVPKPTEVENPSGSFTDLEDPDPGTISLVDIAHRLSQVNRFGGAASHPYSVAQHALFCARRMAEVGGSARLQLLCLHHDDPEAYICDTPPQVKSMFGPGFRHITKGLESAICMALGVPPATEDERRAVKQVDSYALLVEALMLMPSRGEHWGLRMEPWHRPGRIEVPSYWRGSQHWHSVGCEYTHAHYRLMHDTFWSESHWRPADMKVDRSVSDSEGVQ